MRVSVPLSAQQEAHVALVLEVHAAAQADLDRRAQQAINVRSQRLAPVLTELGIPIGADISVVARANGEPAHLSYEGPEPEQRLGLPDVMMGMRAKAQGEPNVGLQQQTEIYRQQFLQDNEPLPRHGSIGASVDTFLRQHLHHPRWVLIDHGNAIRVTDSGITVTTVFADTHDWASIRADLGEAVLAIRRQSTIPSRQSDPSQPDAGSRPEKSTSADAPES